ncbi:AcrR family transcriptional regulator [Sphingobium sp. OAS761]|uniref:TetR/AcrR family transcriptional regulator n=1 Tax=Sphingobium sp. OAS761 TaxID=2817901 RepID=UPI0020A18448|nr:TetR/AcrR family transcriptional regulator [Sphingobium sp. OAS761]MCP1470610.1 AcrR family transcriptional regulator [Sphingobium sp. OAS761]
MVVSGAVEKRASGPQPSSLDAILDAASRELLAHGFDGMSVERIAAGARVSKSTIYGFFASKAEILETTVDHVTARANVAVGLPSLAGDMSTDLAELARWVRSVTLSSEMIGLYRVSIELAARLPERADAIHALWKSRAGPLRDFFDTQVLTGLSRDVDISFFQTAFGFVSINGLWDVVGLPMLTGPLEQAWLESVSTLFRRGYRARAGVSSHRDGLALPQIDVDDMSDLYDRRRSAGMRLSRDQFEDLLQTCVDIFLEHGYLRASLQMIADATGVSKMTLLRQFRSKEILFEQTMLWHAQRLYDARKPLALSGDVQEALRAAGRILNMRFRDHDNIKLLRLAVAEAQRFPALCSGIYALSRRGEIAALSRKFDEARREGLLCVDHVDFAAEQFRLLSIRGNQALFRESMSAGGMSPSVEIDAVRIFLNGMGNVGVG